MRNYVILVLFVISLLLLGSVDNRVYPDGPFKVYLIVDGRNIETNNSIDITISTDVVENKAAGAYTKTPALTFYNISPVRTIAPNQYLDSWFLHNSTLEKNVLIRINDGQNRILEAWKIYKIKPLRRELTADGYAIYYFKPPNLITRDEEVVFP